MKQPTEHDRILNMLFGFFATLLWPLVMGVELWKTGIIFALSGMFWWHLCAFVFPKAVDRWYEIMDTEELDD